MTILEGCPVWRLILGVRGGRDFGIGVPSKSRDRGQHPNHGQIWRPWQQEPHQAGKWSARRKLKRGDLPSTRSRAQREDRGGPTFSRAHHTRHAPARVGQAAGLLGFSRPKWGDTQQRSPGTRHATGYPGACSTSSAGRSVRLGAALRALVTTRSRASSIAGLWAITSSGVSSLSFPPRFRLTVVCMGKPAS